MKEKLLVFLLVVGGLMTFVWNVFPAKGAQDRLQTLPKAGPGFGSVEVPLTPEEKVVLGGVDVLKRLYRVGHQRFLLTVIDGAADRHAVHDPAYCFRGAGWEVISRKDFPVPGGEAALLTLGKGNDSREALFWISDDEIRHAQPARYWLQTALRRLTFGYAGPEPVMVIAQQAGPEGVDWRRLANEFPQLFMF